MEYNGITRQRVSPGNQGDTRIIRATLTNDDTRSITDYVNRALDDIYDGVIQQSYGQAKTTVYNLTALTAGLETPEQRVYTTLQKRVSNGQRHIHTVSTIPEPAVNNAQHGHAYAQPQLGSLLKWNDEDAKFEHPENRRRIGHHLYEEIKDSLDKNPLQDVKKDNPDEPRDDEQPRLP